MKIRGSILLVSTLFLGGVGLGFSGSNLSKASPNVSNDSGKVSPHTRVAVCPTFYRVAQGLQELNYEVVRTRSTSQSLSLLKAKAVEYALSGRILMPGEPSFHHQILGTGYAFLAHETLVLGPTDLTQRVFFTDLDTNEVRGAFGLTHLKPAKNPYKHLEEGILITSWSRADFAKAKLVHVMGSDGLRNVRSRIPVAYCLKPCDENTLERFKAVLAPHFDLIPYPSSTS